MNKEKFDKTVGDVFHVCTDTLCNKAKEYATVDRLHNFKVAAQLQNCTPVKSLGGMMCKHTVSVYDLINDYENGKDIPMDMWHEKIIDSINYLLLLIALLHDDDSVNMCK